MRARVEGAGRVELGSAEAAALTRTKAVHVALIVLAVLAGLWPSHQVLSTHPPFLAFLLGGMVESFTGASAAETARRLGNVMGAWLVGLSGFWVMLASQARG